MEMKDYESLIIEKDYSDRCKRNYSQVSREESLDQLLAET